MKRMILEWGVVLSVGIALSIMSLWVYTRFIDRSTYHLRISTSPDVRHDIHVLVSDGNLWLCDQFERDASGHIRPLIVDTITAADTLKGNRLGQFTIPGLDLRYYRLASDGYLIWSLKLSLGIPFALSLLSAALVRRRLKNCRGHREGVAQGGIHRRSPPSDRSSPKTTVAG